jgi:hypothetical protein
MRDGRQSWLLIGLRSGRDYADGQASKLTLLNRTFDLLNSNDRARTRIALAASDTEKVDRPEANAQWPKSRPKFLALYVFVEAGIFLGRAGRTGRALRRK